MLGDACIAFHRCSPGNRHRGERTTAAGGPHTAPVGRCPGPRAEPCRAHRNGAAQSRSRGVHSDLPGVWGRTRGRGDETGAVHCRTDTSEATGTPLIANCPYPEDELCRLVGLSADFPTGKHHRPRRPAPANESPCMLMHLEPAGPVPSRGFHHLWASRLQSYGGNARARRSTPLQSNAKTGRFTTPPPTPR